MKAYKKVHDHKKHNAATKRTNESSVVFSESPYQLIVKYVFDLLLMDCCMKLVFSLSAIICVMQKNVSELMKNDIERKYGSNCSNGSYGCNGNSSSNGKNNVYN